MPDLIVRELPRWLVRHICRPENHKLQGKFPATWYGATESKWLQHNHRPIDRRLPAIYRNTFQDLSDDQALKGNLNTNDYRLWAEVKTWEGAPNYGMVASARCRWCSRKFKLDVFRASARQFHKNDCHFTHNLKAIYEIFLADKACVSCGAHTKLQKWGIPLCSPKCETAWKFAEQSNQAFGVAMNIAYRSNKIKLTILGDQLA